MAAKRSDQPWSSRELRITTPRLCHWIILLSVHRRTLKIQVFMQKLLQLAISAEGFVFNPATGDSFQVSPTGLVVLNGLRDETGRKHQVLGFEEMEP